MLVVITDNKSPAEGMLHYSQPIIMVWYGTHDLKLMGQGVSSGVQKSTTISCVKSTVICRFQSDWIMTTEKTLTYHCSPCAGCGSGFFNCPCENQSRRKVFHHYRG